MGNQSCIPGAGSAVGSRPWVPPGIGLHCGGAGPAPPAASPMAEQDAGCFGYPSGAAQGCSRWWTWQLQHPRFWLQRVGAGTTWLPPGVTSCLPVRDGDRALGAGTALSSLPELCLYHRSLCRASPRAKLLCSAGAWCWPGWPQPKGESAHSRCLLAGRAPAPALAGGPRP